MCNYYNLSIARAVHEEVLVKYSYPINTENGIVIFNTCCVCARSKGLINKQFKEWLRSFDNIVDAPFCFYLTKYFNRVVKKLINCSL